MNKRKNLAEMSKNNADYLLNRKKRYKKREPRIPKRKTRNQKIMDLNFKQKKIIEKYIKMGEVFLKGSLKRVKELKYYYDESKKSLNQEIAIHPDYSKLNIEIRNKLIYLVNKNKCLFLSKLRRHNYLLERFGKDEFFDIGLNHHKNISQKSEKIELFCSKCQKEYSTYMKMLIFDQERFSMCPKCRKFKLCRICGGIHYNSGSTCSKKCRAELSRIKSNYFNFNNFMKRIAESLLDEEFFIYQELEEEFENQDNF